MEKIQFTYEGDSGLETADFYVIEQTRINGVNYLLVTEQDGEEDAEAYILKDLSEASASESIYEMVEEEAELDAVYQVFAELLEEIDLKKE